MKIKLADEVYDFDPQALTLREATQLKIQAGLDLSDMVTLNVNDPRVLQAVIWLCRRRRVEDGGGGELRLAYDDVDIPLRDVDMVFDDPEPVEESPTVATLPPELGGSPNGGSTSTSESASEAATG